MRSARSPGLDLGDRSFERVRELLGAAQRLDRAAKRLA
jgi:hypothetical protein